MSQLFEFKAEVTEATETGGLVARMVPFGEKVSYGSGTVRFEDGSITVPPTVPLTIDHSPSVEDRIGVMVSSFSDPTGLYGEFKISDTPKGQAIRTLLADGALQDVSVGVQVSDAVHGRDEVQEGVLDHLSIVSHGRFAADGVENPSKVLQVHDVKEPNMGEGTEEAVAPAIVEYDDSALKSELVEYKAEIARLSGEVDTLTEAVEPKAAEFTALEVFGAMVGQRLGITIDHALADVIGDLGSADASGIVPDFYWAGGLQHLTDRRRPLFATAGAAPFPSSGNNLVLPRVTQSTSVAKRAAEKGAANSQALQAVAQTYPIQWFDGAVDVALELIAQSDPAVLGVIATDMLTQYAKAVEADATALLTAAATATGAVLDTATYAALVADLITTSDLIEDAVGAPGDICGVNPAQWIAILSLMDGGDRRQFSIINPSNADGTGTLTTRGIDIGGIFVYRAPDAVSAVQYNQTSYKAGEKSPVQVQALNVELMGRDVGILGATGNTFWEAGIYSYEV